MAWGSGQAPVSNRVPVLLLPTLGGLGQSPLSVSLGTVQAKERASSRAWAGGFVRPQTDGS